MPFDEARDARRHAADSRHAAKSRQVAEGRPRAAAKAADNTPTNAAAIAEQVWSGSPFLRHSALEAGVVTENELRQGFVRLAPRIYVVRWAQEDPHARVRAVAMWAPREAVLAGAGAALLHGERWLSAAAVSKPIDVYLPGGPRHPKLVRYRRKRPCLRAEHVALVQGIPCTTISRTAVDLARWERDDIAAVVAVDSLCNSTGTTIAEVAESARGMRRLHGLARARALLGFCDHRADSPPETRFRLLIKTSPLPDAEPQVRIFNRWGGRIATADLAYRHARVALFYDGGHHLQREQRDFDSNVTAALDEHGWRSLRVTAGMLRGTAERATLLRRIAGLLAAQGVAVPEM